MDLYLIQLWVRILTSKYGGWADLSNGRDKVWHSQWWRDLRKLFQQPEFSSIHQHMVWKVGGGDKVKFQKDKWLGADSNLEQQYNQLFLISGQQNSTISNMGIISQGQLYIGLITHNTLQNIIRHNYQTILKAIASWYFKMTYRVLDLSKNFP